MSLVIDLIGQLNDLTNQVNNQRHKYHPLTAQYHSDCEDDYRSGCTKGTKGTKRGNTCKGRQTREYVQRAPSAGIRAKGAKRGNTCNGRQAREYVQMAPSAEKCVKDD